MKFEVTSALIAVFIFATTSSFVAAQQVQMSPGTVVVGSGNDLRCRLEKGLRITKPGEPITAKLTDPIYVGTTLAIPEGATIKGYVSSVSTAPWNKRAGRLLSGDLTPPKFATVTFDRVVLFDGTAIKVHTDATAGIVGIRTAQYLPKSQRPGVRQKATEAFKPFSAPNKLRRISEAALKSLPYHPEYFEEGTVFDATLTEPAEIALSVQPALEVSPLPGGNYLHLRLQTALNSEMTAGGTPVSAVVSQPYYNSDRTLLYPAGTKLEGTVSKASSANWMKKNGGLRFSFDSAQTPDGTRSELSATVTAVQVAGGGRLAVGEEGDLKGTTSRLDQLSAPLSFISPAMATADPSLNKTALVRGTAGLGGFGLLGAGAAQASAGTATGFGYFGAAKRTYEAFIAKGLNVDLPVNTPILMRVDERPRPTTDIRARATSPTTSLLE